MTYRYIYYTEHNVGMPGLDMPHTAEKEFISVLLAFMSPAEQQALEQQQFPIPVDVLGITITGAEVERQ